MTLRAFTEVTERPGDVDVLGFKLTGSTLLRGSVPLELSGAWRILHLAEA